MIAKNELELEEIKSKKILDEILKVMKSKRMLAESEPIKPIGLLNLRKRGS